MTGNRTEHAQSPVRRADVRRWATAWWGVAGVGVVNGGVHRLYIDPLGELAAHQVSGLTFAALYLPYVWAVDRRCPTPSARSALGVGVAWATGAVVFDTLVGHYLAGDSWAEVRRAYDLGQGRIWSLVVLLIAAGPFLARSLRRHRARS